MIAASTTNLSVLLDAEPAPVPLVDDVSISVEAGTVLGVLGETGAGKTLTIRAVLGLLGPAMIVEGRIELGGEEVRDRVAARESLRGGVVLQNPAGMLDPLMRLGDQLVEAVVYHKRMSKADAYARAGDLLEQLGFDRPQDVMRLFPHQLSGGMAQRAAVAMAMMPEPALLVVDEPTSGLDASLRIELLTLLRRIARENDSAIVMVSHDLGLVGRFCDTLAVMYAGRVVEQGPTADVFRDPRHPYTAALFATAPSLASPSRSPLPIIPGSPPAPGKWPSGCPFRTRCPHAFERCESRPPLPEDAVHAAACHLVPAEVGA